MANSDIGDHSSMFLYAKEVVLEHTNGKYHVFLRFSMQVEDALEHVNDHRHLCTFVVNV